MVLGIGGIGDEALGTVNNVIIAVFAGCGSNGADVGAGIRLGQAEGDQLPLIADRRKEALLLLLGPAEQQG